MPAGSQHNQQADKMCRFTVFRSYPGESAFSARTEELQVCLETERDTRNNWKWPWHNPDETTGIFNRFFLCVSCIKYYELVKQNLNCSRKMKKGKKEA